MVDYALVTGASRNIGRAIAARLKADGYRVLMLDRIEPEDPSLGEFMHVDLGMADTVAPFMPSPPEIAACTWLSESDLAVYSAEFARTGLQGGLNWYRCNADGSNAADLRRFAGRQIEVPALFIAGQADWGVHQSPGAFDALDKHCADLRGRHLIAGAGHWVQQEQPEAVVARLLEFLGA